MSSLTWHAGAVYRIPLPTITKMGHEPKIVVSTGDPEAALGVDKDHVFRPLYTLQTIRDVDSPFILSYDVFAQATDAGTLPLMLERTEQLTGRRLKEVLADSGYVTGIDLALCAQEGSIPVAARVGDLLLSSGADAPAGGTRNVCA